MMTQPKRKSVLVLMVLLICGPMCFSETAHAQSGATEDAEELARQILDEDRPREERLALVETHAADRGAAIVESMVRDLGTDTQQEYDRIPWIWRVSIALSEENRADQIRQLLEVSLPQEGEALQDWEAVVIGGGVINGLSRQGVWPSHRIDEILEGHPDLLARWQWALEESAAMTDDKDVPLPTRYDALRMIAMEPWSVRGAQLVSYLDSEEGQLQMGAVSGLSDVRSPQVAGALLSAWDHYSPRNRQLALDALLRTDVRIAALLDAIAAGRVTADDLEEERIDQLRDADHPQLRQRARQLLPE